MFLTPGHVLIVRVLVKSGILHTFKRGFLKNVGRSYAYAGMFSLGDFRLDILRQHVLRNAGLL